MSNVGFIRNTSTFGNKLQKTHHSNHDLSTTASDQGSEMDSLIFSLVASSVSLIGAMLSCAVLLLLRTNRNAKQKNSILIKVLVAFCAVENCCFVVLWGSSFMFKEGSTRNAIRRFLFIVCTGIYQMFVFSLVAMTVDRFVAFFRPFKYKKMITRGRLRKYYCGTSLLTIAIRIPFLVGWSSVSIGYLFQIDIVLETLLLLPQPIFYVVLYKKWKSKRSRFSVMHNNTQVDANTKKRRQAEHRTLIVLSIILFVTCLAQVFSDALHVAGEELSTTCDERIMGYLSDALWIFVVFITPLCHVFVKPSARHRFNSTMRRSFRNIHFSVRTGGTTTYELEERSGVQKTTTLKDSPYPSRYKVRGNSAMKVMPAIVAQGINNRNGIDAI